VVEAQGGVVPRVSLYRLIGDTVSTQLFSDQGRAGTVQTTYEESVASGHTYFVAVAHSGRGADAGTYRFVTELLPARPRIAHEPNDDRARATRVHIGEAVHGSFENTRDVDVFAIPVTDPQHRSIEIEMDEVFRGRVRLTLSGVNAASTVHFPRVEDDRDRMRAPQPHTPPRTIRFGGEGETYYLSVRPRRGRRHDGGYSFRVVRVMKEETAPAVGGPGY